MRLPVNQAGAGRANARVKTITLASVLVGALAAPLLARSPVPPVAPSGPAADYPMVLGAPFVVDGVTHTPADTMNIDQVGYAVADPEASAGVSIAHRTLPLPSYVEVTSLKTGRTILARVERRGPMTGSNLIALSVGAAAQLGIAPDGADLRTPVRVRRVNPPEAERALLRAGQTAPARMDTPMSLVGVLLRKLDPALPPPAVAVPAPAPAAVAAPAQPPLAPVATISTAAAKPAAALPSAPVTPKPAAAAPKGKVFVQVGAFSTRERAQTAARQVGGTVTPSGKLFRVRITGFDGSAQAAGALAKAKAAGYSDARIQRAD